MSFRLFDWFSIDLKIFAEMKKGQIISFVARQHFEKILDAIDLDWKELFRHVERFCLGEKKAHLDQAWRRCFCILSAHTSNLKVPVSDFMRKMRVMCYVACFLIVTQFPPQPLLWVNNHSPPAASQCLFHIHLPNSPCCSQSCEIPPLCLCFNYAVCSPTPRAAIRGCRYICCIVLD